MREADICPRCGQPTLPANLIPLPPLKARILDLVQRHPGIDAETLRTLVWASDPSGGPEDRKVLHVHIHQLNQLLATHGLRVRGSRSFGYRVQRI
jgi:DNA-binding response OmpR family regulator